MQTIGWSMGKNKVGDETGVWHLLVLMPNTACNRDIAVPACQKTRLVRISGQVTKNPGGNLCRRCAVIAMKQHIGTQRKDQND